MKSLFYCIIVLLFISCDKNDNLIENQEESIIGFWQVIRTEFGTGGTLITTEISDGQIIKIFSDDTFEFVDNDSNCSSGTYMLHLDNSEIQNSGIIEFECNNIENQFWIFSINNSELTYSLTNENGEIFCDEGCNTICLRINQ